MELKHLEAAIAEAERFLTRAKQLCLYLRCANDEYIPNLPRESGATRRASLDLTRALADLRRRKS